MSTMAQNVNTPMILPSIESIEEFKLQSSSYAAKYGRGTGTISVTSKSGTKKFRGSLYEFWRVRLL